MVTTLQQAVSFIKSGDKVKGKRALLQLLKQEPENDKAWVWLTAVVDTDEMRLECLEKALLINPQNQLAAKGVAKLREKMGLPEEDEELIFPELTAQRWERPAVSTTETWSYEPYKPQPPPPPEPTRTKKATTKAQSAFLSTPFFTILFAPRVTVQTILRHNPKRHVMLLSILLGILMTVLGVGALATVLPFLNFLSAGIVITQLIFGAVYGIVYFYVAGYIISMLGFIWGGTGTPSEVRTALVWSYVPRIYLFPLLGLLVYLIAEHISAMDVTRSSSFSDLLSPQVVILGFIAAAIGFWLFYTYLECIGAAHDFSFWRAWATILLPTLLVLTVFFIIQAVACWPILGINWELYPQCLLFY